MPFLKWKYLPLRRAHCVHGLCLSWNISTQIPTPTIKPEYTCQKYKCQREGVKLRSRADKSLRTGLQHQATKREVGLRSPGAQGRRRPHQVLKMPPVRIRRATVSTHTKGGWSQRQHAKDRPYPSLHTAWSEEQKVTPGWRVRDRLEIPALLLSRCCTFRASGGWSFGLLFSSATVSRSPCLPHWESGGSK